MLLFSRWPGTAIAHTHKFVGVQHNKTFERRQCIPNMRFRCVSSKKKLIQARIGLIGDYEGRDFTICVTHPLPSKSTLTKANTK